MVIKEDYCLLFCKNCEYYKKEINKRAKKRAIEKDPGLFTMVFNYDDLKNNGENLSNIEKLEIEDFLKNQGKFIHLVFNDIYENIEVSDLFKKENIFKITISFNSFNKIKENKEVFLNMYKEILKINKSIKLRVFLNNKEEIEELKNFIFENNTLLHSTNIKRQDVYNKVNFLTSFKNKRTFQKLILPEYKINYCNDSFKELKEVYES